MLQLNRLTEIINLLYNMLSKYAITYIPLMNRDAFLMYVFNASIYRFWLTSFYTLML